MRVPSDHQLLQLAHDALTGPLCLDYLVTTAIFGTDAPRFWGDWPRDAIEAHRQAVAFYDDLRNNGLEPTRTKVKPRAKNSPGLIESWEAVLDLTPPGSRWFVIPNVTWAEIAAILKISAPAASYRYNALGWRFGGCRSTRRVEVAPCIECATPAPAVQIHDRVGVCCDD
jgi:hypothetical protein